jgi:hypothetical protein
MHTAKVGEKLGVDDYLSNAEENRANFCKILEGRLHFSALYGIYILTVNELKIVMKVNAQAGQSGRVTKTSGIDGP